MKIYNFSSGKRGQLLLEQRHRYHGDWTITRSDGSTVQVALNGYHFADRVGYYVSNGHPIGQDDDWHIDMNNILTTVGVEAICFCTGKNRWNENRWEWRFIATRNWLNENRSKLTIRKANDSNN